MNRGAWRRLCGDVVTISQHGAIEKGELCDSP
jgi:hypothetical protein